MSAHTIAAWCMVANQCITYSPQAQPEPLFRGERAGAEPEYRYN
jgi:hypothetical protein